VSNKRRALPGCGPRGLAKQSLLRFDCFGLCSRRLDRCCHIVGIVPPFVDRHFAQLHLEGRNLCLRLDLLSQRQLPTSNDKKANQQTLMRSFSASAFSS